MSLSEICENAKMAREYALLGNYDTSLVYYQGVIQQIQKHIQQLKDDAIMKQEWHQVNLALIGEHLDIWSVFHNGRRRSLQKQNGEGSKKGIQ